MADIYEPIPMRTKTAGDVAAKICKSDGSVLTDPSSVSLSAAIPAGTNVIGHVINDASTAVIGHVIADASTAVIGHVINDAGTASIGTVGLDAGTAEIGTVTVKAGGTIGLEAGTASIGDIATVAEVTSVGSIESIVDVNIVSQGSGTPICVADVGSAIANDASSTQTYTVTALKHLQEIEVYASAGGAMKVEVKVGASGSEISRAVLFTTGASHVYYKCPIISAAGEKVLVIKTNKSGSAMDVYSTIQGEEV